MTSKNTKYKLSALILDFDGVIWHDSKPVGDLPSIFEQIRRRGWHVVIVTNNSTRVVDDYLKEFRAAGVELVSWQVINSALVAANYLKKNFPQGSKIHVVGEASLSKLIRTQGFEISDEQAVAVVAGLDRELTFNKLVTATRLIRKGAFFIGTNPDPTYMTPDGLVPAEGTIIAAIETASGVKPLIAGKPEPEIFLQALGRLGTKPAETLVVGDRLETDIVGGKSVGCPTALVLTGVTSPEEARQSPIRPDMIAEDLSMLIKSID